MRFLIRSLDRYLRRRMEVFEFWEHPDCLIRVRVTHSNRPLTVAHDVVPAGAKVVEIHFWNEQVPRIPSEGVDMKWATRGVRMLALSFTELAKHMAKDERYKDVTAVGGITPLFFAGQDSSGERIWKRLGFTMTPHKQTLGRFGEFWENLHTWMIMWAFNPQSVRNRRLLDMRRTEFWMTATDFLQRYNK